jgi:hypothetical protein
MASIARRSDGRWRARHRDASGREFSRHFGRKVDAQRWLDSVASDKASGNYADASLSRVTVGEWSRKWLDSKINLKPTTRRDYESLLTAHIEPRWGPIALANVKHEDVVAWLAELS